MARHIYFVAPEATAPVGGINVMYQFAEILRDHGYSVSVHYHSPDFVYEFFESDVETTYSPLGRDRHPDGLRGIRSRYWEWTANRRKPRRSKANRLSVPGAQDVVVLPEFWYASQVKRFPDAFHLILLQVLLNGLRHALLPIARSELLPRGRTAILATSQLCAVAAEIASDLPVKRAPLFLDRTDFRFQQTKSRRIAYMPRKRPAECEALVGLLKTKADLRGFEFSSIGGQPAAEVRKTLADSLFFLSLSRNEGFGLPPAEAMAMGCITIGYTGVGGNEYFTPDISFPVPEDDIIAFYRTVIDVVEEYDREPTRLDAMRKAASDHILSTYTKEKTTHALLKAIEEIAK